MLPKPIGNKTFSERAQAGRHLLYGISYVNNKGDDLYYYALIDPLKEKQFLKAMCGNAVFNMHEFGKIVHAGLGEPGEAVKHEMRTLYGAKI